MVWEIDVSVLGVAGITSSGGAGFGNLPSLGGLGPMGGRAAALSTPGRRGRVAAGFQQIDDASVADQGEQPSQMKIVVGFMLDDNKNHVFATTGFSNTVSCGSSGGVIVQSTVQGKTGKRKSGSKKSAKDKVHQTVFMDLMGLERFMATWDQQNGDPRSGIGSLVAFETQDEAETRQDSLNTMIDLKLVVAMAECTDYNNEQQEYFAAYPIGWCDVSITAKGDDLHILDVPVKYITGHDQFSVIELPNPNYKGSPKIQKKKSRTLSRFFSRRKLTDDKLSVDEPMLFEEAQFSEMDEHIMNHLKAVALEQAMIRLQISSKRKEVNVELSLEDTELPFANFDQNVTKELPFRRALSFTRSRSASSRRRRSQSASSRRRSKSGERLRRRSKSRDRRTKAKPVAPPPPQENPVDQVQQRSSPPARERDEETEETYTADDDVATTVLRYSPSSRRKSFTSSQEATQMEQHVSDPPDQLIPLTECVAGDGEALDPVIVAQPRKSSFSSHSQLQRQQSTKEKIASAFSKSLTEEVETSPENAQKMERVLNNGNSRRSQGHPEKLNRHDNLGRDGSGSSGKKWTSGCFTLPDDESIIDRSMNGEEKELQDMNYVPKTDEGVVHEAQKKEKTKKQKSNVPKYKKVLEPFSFFDDDDGSKSLEDEEESLAVPIFAPTCSGIKQLRNCASPVAAIKPSDHSASTSSTAASTESPKSGSLLQPEVIIRTAFCTDTLPVAPSDHQTIIRVVGAVTNPNTCLHTCDQVLLTAENTCNGEQSPRKKTALEQRDPDTWADFEEGDTLETKDFTNDTSTLEDNDDTILNDGECLGMDSAYQEADLGWLEDALINDCDPYAEEKAKQEKKKNASKKKKEKPLWWGDKMDQEFDGWWNEPRHIPQFFDAT